MFLLKLQRFVPRGHIGHIGHFHVVEGEGSSSAVAEAEAEGIGEGIHWNIRGLVFVRLTCLFSWSSCAIGLTLWFRVIERLLL